MSHIGEGYVNCACGGCFEITIGTPGEELCDDCEEAGCTAGESTTECAAIPFDDFE